MSREKVNLVRSIYAAWERGDWSASDPADPEIELVLTDIPDVSGSFKGMAATAAGWRKWLSAWEDYRVKAEEYRDLDSERVLVLFDVIARGKTSGVDFAQAHAKGAALYHLRDGKATSVVAYLDREHGVADLGLSE